MAYHRPVTGINAVILDHQQKKKPAIQNAKTYCGCCQSHTHWLYPIFHQVIMALCEYLGRLVRNIRGKHRDCPLYLLVTEAPFYEKPRITRAENKELFTLLSNKQCRSFVTLLI